MSHGPGQALVQALALLRAPRGARPGPQEALPDGMLALLRIVAGEEEVLGQAVAATGETAATVREAAVFYIQQVMFDPDGDAYRVLGTARDAQATQLREHYRWLARWLHPDRNPDSWEALYLDRVNQAWQQIRTPERRKRHDLEFERAAHPSAPGGPMPGAAYVPMLVGKHFDARRGLRWLPTAILAGLGVFAICMVAVLYAVQRAERLAGQFAASESPRTEAAIAPIAAAGAVAAPPVPPPDPREVAEPVTEVGTAVVALNLPKAPPATAPAPVLVPVPVTAAPPPAPIRRSDRALFSTAEQASSSPSKRPEAKLAHAPGSAALIAAPVPSRQGQGEARLGTLVYRRALAIADAPQPAAAPATNPQDMAPAFSITQRDANRLLGDFSRAYSDGDLGTLRKMLAEDVRGPRGGIEVILADYEKVFRSSEARSLSVRNVSWFGSGESFSIVASFEASVVEGRSRKVRKSHGDIRLDLRLEADQWRIYRLSHDERQG